MSLKISESKRLHNILAFALGAGMLWLLEFKYQHYILIPDDLGLSLVRSFALTAATLISFALSLSALFKWFPRAARCWRLRRYSGVAGFAFAALHVWSVYYYLYNYDIGSVYRSFNPFENPVVFGSVGFFVLFLLASTSSDWAVAKLTPRAWKNLHRIIYVGYWGIVFHMSSLSVDLLNNVAGYFLFFITAFALFGQLYWYIRIAGKKRFQSLGAFIGALTILLYLGTAYIAYRYKTGAPENERQQAQ